ncbi:MAG: calcium/sodium antiporter [Candidatus Liptonbacteria bacterium]|nr:calcium/sodium antiporter [Candidatus Liptonbacteria bacterium]
MVADILILLFGLVFLVKGSTSLVRASTGIAKRLGISDFVIGLTLVALGTSIPELASGIVASFQREGNLVIGNIVGANMANIALIVGIAALIAPLKTAETMLKRDGYIMLFATFLFYAFALNGTISQTEGVILLFLYLAYIAFLFEAKSKSKRHYQFKEFLRYFLGFGFLTALFRSTHIGRLPEREHPLEQPSTGTFLKNFLVFTISGIAIVFGANLAVGKAIAIADFLSVPTALVGILFALGTTLPEFSVSVAAARHGHSDIAIGNIIGSNITNIFLVIGVAASIFPLPVLKLTLFYAGPALIVLTALLLVFIKTKWEIRRNEGVILIALYALFLILMFL